MKTTDLQKLIDWETILPLPRYAGGHDEQMKSLFRGARVLAHWNEGDYEGTVATAAIDRSHDPTLQPVRIASIPTQNTRAQIIKPMSWIMDSLW